MMSILIRLTILFTLVFKFSIKSNGQIDSASEKWALISNRYKDGQLKDKEYLIEVQTLLYNDIANGIYYKHKELIEKLASYKKIVWGNKAFNKKKTHYYILLLNNAKMQGRVGEAIYYAEKADQMAALNGKKALNTLEQKCYFFDEQKSYDKVIEAYKEEEAYIFTYPKLIAEGKLSYDDGINLMLTLTNIVNAFSHVKDSVSITKIIALSESIFKIFPSKKADGTPLSHFALISRFYIQSMKFYFAYETLNDNVQAQLCLDSISRLLTVEEYRGLPDFLQIVETNLISYKLNFFIETKNIDSAYKYLEKYKEAGMLSENQESETSLSEGRINANQKNFEFAYNALLKTIKLNNKEHTQLANEMDELLYAHTKAESTASELDLTRIENRKRNYIILLVSIVLLFTFLIVYIKLRIKNTKIKAQIDSLNSIASLRIAAMEESKNQAIIKEQEQLAQDIHDDLAGSIASVKHQLEAITLDSENEALNNQLNTTLRDVEDIYRAARSKSHHLFNKSQALQSNSLTESILVLTSSALPAGKYNLDIQIDEETAYSLSFEYRINILKIIQEAIINIIKHSKATEVSLFLYDTNENKIVLQISDNGVGMNLKSANSGIGLASIKKRVKELNGYLDLYNDNGLVLNIMFSKEAHLSIV